MTWKKHFDPVPILSPYGQYKRLLSKFFIKNGNDYLYFNDALLSKEYFWKKGKLNATTFCRKDANKVMVYLKRKGWFNVRKEVVK